MVGRDCSSGTMYSVSVAEGNGLESVTICGRLAASAKSASCYTKPSLRITVARIIDRGNRRSSQLLL